VRAVVAFMLAALPSMGAMRVVELPSKSPLVTFRLVFSTGSVNDPAGKPGLAALTAQMMASSGTRSLTYKQVVDALFPMATGRQAQVDKEMTTFGGQTHIDNLEAYYALFRDMVLDPGWREEDFKRVKDDAVNSLRVSLRGNNDEELGKEVLYETIHAGTPYQHYAAGWAGAIEKMTLDDVRQFYRTQYAQSNLILGLAGGYSPAFLERVKKDFSRLPAQAPGVPKVAAPTAVKSNRLIIVEKDTRSVAYSLGFPIPVTRSHPDYAALLVAQSYLGQHRSGGRLFDRIREARGLNYGDYAYIEYFPRGMFVFEPSPNLARRHQIFQIWIRPLEPATAHFGLRLAMFELDRLVKNGLTADEFERSRQFLAKYVNLLTKTKREELGYAIDSLWYGIPNYNQHLKANLAKLTLESVNAAIRRHLRSSGVVMVAVSRNGEQLKQQFTGSALSPMKYNSPKPAEITEEDKTVEKWDLALRPEDVTILPAAKVFE
jgi:zinc protease